jgi:hypothetical protein
MDQQAQTFDSYPACSTTPQAFVCGRLVLPWDRLIKVGVSYQRDPRRGGTAFYVHFAYRDQKTGKAREGLTLIPSPEHPLVSALQARVPAQWAGTHPHLAMRRELGFSNKVIYTLIVGTIVLALAITAAIIWSVMGARR